MGEMRGALLSINDLSRFSFLERVLSLEGGSWGVIMIDSALDRSRDLGIAT